MNRYQFLKHLGSGSFGTVSLFKSCAGEVCIKQIQKPANEQENEQIMGEIYIISRVKHPNIIKYIEYFLTRNHIYLVMEYANNGTLRHYLDSFSRHFQQQEIVNMFCDMLLGLEYLHIRRVIHRDLKPENVLIGANRRLKIADFGVSLILSKYSDKTHDNAVGTMLYIAPELLKDGKGDFKVDVWSLGCILFELCKREIMIKAKSVPEARRMLLYPKYNAVPCSFHQGQHLENLCQNMLTFNPCYRTSIPQIIIDCTILFTYYDLYFKYTYG